ncbi:MAG TPA: beta-ketoacyl-ACP synthase III [Polyangia bacterium]|jgi:3-oxoacyl-[acyl-carrier-protein] synthase-3
MGRTLIAGTGRGLPERVLSNADLEQMVDTSDSWIVERTGIRERRIIAKGQTSSDLAATAGLHACRKAGIDPATLDCIIVSTVTPDSPLPATAVHVQRKLGAGGCAAFDMAAACAGFIYGLSVGDAFIARGQFKRVLVVGVEVLSPVIDWEDRNTCVLFGDGAGAAVLVPGGDAAGDRGLWSTHLYADGTMADALGIPAGGTALPASQETVAQRLHYVKMNGREVFKHAVRNMSRAALTALEHNGLTITDVDTVLAHQANMRIVEGVAKQLALPLDKFFINLPKYGNTSSASIPIALDEALEAGRVKQGDLLLMTALGAGFSWGSAVVRL